MLTQIRTSELGGKYQLFDGKGQPFLRADYKPRSPCILCRYSPFPSALTTVGRGWSISAPHLVQKTSALWAPMLGPGGKGGIWSGTLMLPSQWTIDIKTSPHSSDPILSCAAALKRVSCHSPHKLTTQTRYRVLGWGVIPPCHDSMFILM